MVLLTTMLLALTVACGEPTAPIIPATKYTAFGIAVDTSKGPQWVGRQGTSHVGDNGQLILLDIFDGTQTTLSSDLTLDYRGGAVGVNGDSVSALTARWRGGKTIDYSFITHSLKDNSTTEVTGIDFDLGPRANCYGYIVNDMASCYGHSNDDDFVGYIVRYDGKEWKKHIRLPDGQGETAFTEVDNGLLIVGRTAQDGLLLGRYINGEWSVRVIQQGGLFASPILFKDGAKDMALVTNRETRRLEVWEIVGMTMKYKYFIYESQAELMRDFGYQSIVNGYVLANDAQGKGNPGVVIVPFSWGAL